MLCPVKFTNGNKSLCDKEKCGFYSCENQKCAVASLSDITSKLSELKTALNKTVETLNDTNTRLTLVAATTNLARITKR